MPKTYADATVYGGFTEAHPDLSRPITVALGKRADTKRWTPSTMPTGALIAKLCQHDQGSKDGPAVVLGEMIVGPRLKTAVVQMTAIGLDLDNGTPADVIDAALERLGRLAVRYSTHSSGTTETVIPRDSLTRWSRQHADGVDIDDDLVRQYLGTKLLPSIAASARIVGEDHLTAGPVVVINHDPIPKHRVVVPLAAPFDLAAEGGGSHADGCKAWARIPEALAAALGVALDRACLDPSRLFYMPRHAPGAAFSASVFGGRLLDWRDLAGDPWTAEADRLTKRDKGSSHGLGRWASRRAHGFQVIAAIEAHSPERLRNQTATGWEIECPFDETHSNPGDQDDRACLAINAGDGSAERFVVTCRHGSCADRSNLDHLAKMIADGWFPGEVLDDSEFDSLASDGEAEDAVRPAEVFEFTDETQLVAALNSRIAMVHVGGAVRFIRRDDPDLSFYSRRDMETALARWRLVWDDDGKSKSRPAFSVWIESPDMAELFGVEFQPDLAQANARRLNLFRGFETKPAEVGDAGSYDLFIDHIENQVAGGDPEKAEYIWGWFADIFQNPGRKPGVALVLRGEKGCGKSTVGEVLSRLIGERYSPVIDSAEGLTGRFSAHLERALLLNVEEAVHAADPRSEGRLKALVTGSRVSIERKGIDARDVPSYFRILMTTNSQHVAPASGAERRFAIYDVTDARLQDAAYFGAMRAELEAGGYPALLRDLLARDISAVDLRKPPRTAGLADQIRLSLKPDQAWWAGILETGAVPFVRAPVDSDHGDFDWPNDQAFTISRADLFASFSQFCPGYRGPPSPAALGKFLSVACPGIRSIKATIDRERVNAYVLPPRAVAKAAFLTVHPGLVLDDHGIDAESPRSAEVVAVDFQRGQVRSAA